MLQSFSFKEKIRDCMGVSGGLRVKPTPYFLKTNMVIIGKDIQKMVYQNPPPKNILNTPLRDTGQLICIPK